jgi:ATP-dependent DNA ligase
MSFTAITSSALAAISSNFQLACEHDLEGIVAKWKNGRYTAGRVDTTWLKVRNRAYTQWEAREEMFERPHEPLTSGGWDSCAVACSM